MLSAVMTRMEDVASVFRPEGLKDGTAAAKVTTALPQNPLEHMSHDEIIADAEEFIDKNGFAAKRGLFRKGALLAQVYDSINAFESINELSEDDKVFIRYEKEHRWAVQTKMLYFLCALCAGCAVAQGMDQTVINGAQVLSYSSSSWEHRVAELDQGSLL
jgi:hypothetical protein